MSTKRTRVLVVDDDQAILDLMRTTLEDAGYEVLTAMDRAALPVAREQRPDLIVLDLLMPTLRGDELCRQLRATAGTAGIPVIAMSAGSNLDTVVGQATFDDWLLKPFGLHALVDTVARWT